ncbi:MAG TPA: SDR family oxidoreductase [Myxococcales bacterium]|nr:SDR family oxidoreductase [Myxococcales bacterium]
MANLDGKTVLVTGASSGIGLEACVKLAGMGADLVMVARDRAKGEAAVASVEKRAGARRPSLMLCDFSSQKSIRGLAGEFRASRPRLHLLVNDAGSVSPRRELTEDGIERTFAVNHLGYFLLTNLLLDLLKASAPARVVNVASIGHRAGTMDLDDLGFEKQYFIMSAYNRSKLGNVLFTRELARRLQGTGVTVNCLHPGAVATNIWSHAQWWAVPFLSLAKLFMVTPEQGGDAIVYLATSPELEGQTGGYYESNKQVRPSRLAQDDALARTLWDASAKMVKLA